MRNLIFSEAWLIGLTSQRLWQIMQEKIIDKSVGQLGSGERAALTWFGARYHFWIPPDPCMVSLLLLLLLETSLAAVTATLCSFPWHAESLSPVQINNITSPRRRMPEKPRASRSVNGFYWIINDMRWIFYFPLVMVGRHLWLTQKVQSQLHHLVWKAWQVLNLNQKFIGYVNVTSHGFENNFTFAPSFMCRSCCNRN